MNVTPARSTTSTGGSALQPLGQVRRRVAVDLTLEHQRPVDVDGELETWILGRHDRRLPLGHDAHPRTGAHLLLPFAP